MKEKILLDTDIGSDIDDSACLAYLLANPMCELVGITTVSGEPVNRAKLASAICYRAGKTEIPIFPGIEEPLLTEQKQPKVPQLEALEAWEHKEEFPINEAISFMQKTIRANPGEITLLAIGPLTNIAALFIIDPEISGLLKRLVIMGGLFSEEGVSAEPIEWNILCDPHAAKIVYEKSVKIHRSVGANVTRKKVVMQADEVRKRFSQIDLLQPVLDFAEIWFKERVNRITFHDPLAAATIFDDKICLFKKGDATVELGIDNNIGTTYWDSTGNMHEAAFSVDSDRFFEHYFNILEANQH